MTIRHGICAVLLALASSPVFALDAAGEQELARLQERWAQINYELPEARREAAFEQLASQAEAATRRNPDSAELKSWEGIILSTWAGAKGGLGALGLAKRARTAFEESLALDPQALDGSAYTSLATLYYQVPGWPIGFGDKAKAAELFDQALRLNLRRATTSGGCSCWTAAATACASWSASATTCAASWWARSPGAACCLI